MEQLHADKYEAAKIDISNRPPVHKSLFKDVLGAKQHEQKEKPNDAKTELI